MLIKLDSHRPQPVPRSDNSDVGGLVVSDGVEVAEVDDEVFVAL